MIFQKRIKSAKNFQAFDHILDNVFEGVQPQDRVGLQIRHPGLEHPIPIPFRRRDQLDANVVLHHIENVQQSRVDFHIDDQMIWEVTKCSVPTGSGRLGLGKRRHQTSNFEEWFDGINGHGASIIKIENTDDLCLARALITAKCNIQQKDSDEGWSFNAILWSNRY